jgi:hypothetical protein
LGRITTVAISKSGQLGRRCTVVACPHVLRAMMAQVSGISVTCGHALETLESSRIGMPGKLSLFLRFAAHRELRDTWQRRSPPEQGGGVWCYGTHGGTRALLLGRVRSHETRGNARALPNREVGSRATRHVTTQEPTLAGRQGLVLLGGGAWMHDPLLVLT